jgi:RNA polymerase sigma factor (sigma-70 family)
MAVAKADFDDRAAARVEAVLRRHHAQLLWIARRWSGSADDAEDALQRALEIYVRRLDSLDPATEFAWLKVVVRHEAMAIRRSRVEGSPLEAEDLSERLPAPGAAVDERAERDERLAQSLEALTRLKPDERMALLLKAQGFSYREIGERLGWTYTKVNRAITEGRRRFLGVFANIESGEECARFAPTLLALVQGAAQAEDVIALRPHLRHCAGCRATVRELHAARRHRLALHLPFLAGVAPVRWLGERLVDGPSSRPLLHGVMQRLTPPDALTGVQLASSGGGRGPAVAALLGLCLSGGAGTYCIATGALPDPTRLVREAGETKKERATPRRKRASERPEPAPRQPPTAEVAGFVTRRPEAPKPTATPQPQSPEPRPRGRPASRSSGPQQEFGFESATRSSSAPSTAQPPTATTATTSPSSSPSSGEPSTTTSSPPPTSGGEFLP